MIKPAFLLMLILGLLFLATSLQLWIISLPAMPLLRLRQRLWRLTLIFGLASLTTLVSSSLLFLTRLIMTKLCV